MKNKQLWCSLALLGGALLVTESASAQTVPLTNAYTFVGMVGNQGKLVSLNLATSECATRNIGGVGGLTGNTTISGTSNTDIIVMISGSADLCGVTITTLVNNGFQITIRGGSGNDLIDAGAFALMTLVGDGGNDSLTHASFGANLQGGSGNDQIWGNSVATFSGGSGNDTMCAGPSVQVTSFAGGLGTDTHCGIGPASSSTYNCAACGL